MVMGRRARATAEQVDAVREQLEQAGMRTVAGRDGVRVLIGCFGEVDAIAPVAVGRLPGVESVVPWRTPYRLAGRQLSPAGRTVVRLRDGAQASVGDASLLVIAGPCSVEGREMLLEAARGGGRAGTGALRGRGVQSRTS